MRKILVLTVLCFISLSSAESVSLLYEEFVRRDEMTLTAEQGAAIQFLIAIKYETQNIVELDILNPPTSFVFRDRGGDICYGDVVAQILRCKNEIGLAGFSFQSETD